MRYGKLIDGGLMYAPATIEVGGMVHYHPSGELYASMGWLPVVDAPHPEIQEGSDPVPYYVSRWEALDGRIVKVWEETAPPEPAAPEPTLGDRVATLEGEVAQLSQQVNTDLADQAAALEAIYTGVTE